MKYFEKTVFLFFSLVGKERKVRLLSLARESKIKESVPSKKLCSRNVEMTYKTRVAEQIFFDGCGVLLRARRVRVSKTVFLIKNSNSHRRKTSRRGIFAESFRFSKNSVEFFGVFFTPLLYKTANRCAISLCAEKCT